VSQETLRLGAWASLGIFVHVLLFWFFLDNYVIISGAIEFYCSFICMDSLFMSVILKFKISRVFGK